MRVGIYYDFSFSGSRPLDGFWERLREQVQAADALGFDSLWFSERHFHDDAAGSMQILLANMARSTRAIRIGSFKVLPIDNPVRVAEDFAMVDLLSAGRLNMGISLGDQREAYRAHRVDWTKREPIFWEALEIIRHAWTNDEFQFLGKQFRFPSHLPARPKSPYRRRPNEAVYVPQWERGPDVPDFLSVTPKPLQEPHPPIWVLATEPSLISGAARQGLSCVFPARLGPKALAGSARRFRQALSRASRGRPECQVACVRDIALGAAVPGQARGASLVGSAGEIIAAIKKLQNDADLNHLIWRIPFPAVDHGTVVQWLRKFACEVQPMLQA